MSAVIFDSKASRRASYGVFVSFDFHEDVRRLLAELYHLLQLRLEHLVVLGCLRLLPDTDGDGLLLRCLEDELSGSFVASS